MCGYPERQKKEFIGKVFEQFEIQGFNFDRNMSRYVQYWFGNYNCLRKFCCCNYKNMV